jgi:hypothetical protein
MPRFNARRKSFNLSWLKSKQFRTLAIGFVIFSGLVYIVQVNSLSTKSFEIKTLEKKISQLKIENQTLELQSAEIKASGELQTRIGGLNMVAVSKTDYLSATAGVVAMVK